MSSNGTSQTSTSAVAKASAGPSQIAVAGPPTNSSTTATPAPTAVAAPVVGTTTTTTAPAEVQPAVAATAPEMVVSKPRCKDTELFERIGRGKVSYTVKSLAKSALHDPAWKKLDAENKETHTRAEELILRMHQSPYSRVIAPMMVALRPQDHVWLEFPNKVRARKFLNKKSDIPEAIDFFRNLPGTVPVHVGFARVTRNIPTMKTFREAVSNKNKPWYAASDGLLIELAMTGTDDTVPITIFQEDLVKNNLALWSERSVIDIKQEVMAKGMTSVDKAGMIDYCLHLLNFGTGDNLQKLRLLVEFYRAFLDTTKTELSNKKRKIVRLETKRKLDEQANEKESQKDKPRVKRRKKSSKELMETQPTDDLEAPGPKNYVDVWTSLNPATEEPLKIPGTLFGTNRAWFVRDSYIRLYDEIMADGEQLTQIVNGTAGIGKSAFLLYLLARLRSSAKPVLLHFHRDANSVVKAVYFPPGGKPESILSSNNDYQARFEGWYESIGIFQSVLLVDGIPSFIKDDIPGVKYVVAKSPSCPIGFMEHDPNRCDRWLDVWSRGELLSYATVSGMTEVEDIVDDNLDHIGGIARYAFQPGAAQAAVLNAIARVGAQNLLKAVTTNLVCKDNEVWDRLLHRRPPAAGVGVSGTTVTFATPFVATRVSMALALEANVSTSHLSEAYRSVGTAGSVRGVLFDAYCARRLASGGSFQVKEIGSATETTVNLLPTTILQKDAEGLSTTSYPSEDIEDKLVWPNPGSEAPAFDVFAVRKERCIAFQMTVSTNYPLALESTKTLVEYFDAIRGDMQQPAAQQYPLFFAVPEDVFKTFSDTYQPITDASGEPLTDSDDSADVSKRLQQFVLKIT